MCWMCEGSGFDSLQRQEFCMLPVWGWFLARFILRSWRWRQCVPLGRRSPLSGRHTSCPRGQHCSLPLVVEPQTLHPRVEAGKNTSTVIPASRKRRRKGNPVVSDETVIYDYESSATLTTGRLHYKLQTRPLFRECASRRRAKQFYGKKKWKRKIWSWASKGCPTPRYTDWPTDHQS
jgi:hypothetical protein